MMKKNNKKSGPFWSQKGAPASKLGKNKRKKLERKSFDAEIEKEKVKSRSKKKKLDETIKKIEPMRLNRFIAKAGVCSRRDADDIIASGKVKVNGKVVTEFGVRVSPKDKVEYRGKVLVAEKLVYFLYNKPKNTISTTSDPLGRNTVIDAIESSTQERVYPVGRLDRNTTGLLILTNDGDVAKKLTHPSHKTPKLYKARLDKVIPEEDLYQLLQGIELEDGIAKADKVDYVLGQPQNEVGIRIHIGRNRVVRRMFKALGYQVEALDRVMIAHLTKKNLPRGKWRPLTEKEIGYLKML
ncbi:rRNA pseudouridine synthase [bacterium]|nr:rRNA pseudouridine synthase [bacterium]